MIDIIIIKRLKLCKNYQSVIQKLEVSKCYWKNGKTQDTGLPQTFNLQKTKKKREKEKENAIFAKQYNEMQ